jgi:cobalt-zinc-cadmium efflux system protein
VLVAESADCHAKRRELEQMLVERFGVSHSTLQVDHASSGPRSVELGTAVPRKTPLR